MLILPIVFGCNKFDDSILWNSINSLNNRVERLETICDKMNTNISSLQSIVQALQTNDAVKSVTTLPDGEGYTINFVSGNNTTLKNLKTQCHTVTYVYNSPSRGTLQHLADDIENS